MFNPFPSPGRFRARPVHLAAPSGRRCGPQVRAQEGPAGVPGPPGPGLDGPGSPVTKRSTFCHVLSRWRVGREEGRKRHSQTLNMALSLPDRGPELGLGSTHKARGPGAKARHRRRSLFVEPDPRVEQTSFARGAYVRLDIFERGEVGERGRAVRHIKAVTLLARTPTRAPFSSPEGRPHQQAPNRDSMISGMGRWRLRVECL